MLLLLLFFAFLKKFVDNFPEQEKHRLIIPFLHVEKFYLDIFPSNCGCQLTYFGVVDMSECLENIVVTKIHRRPLLRNQEALQSWTKLLRKLYTWTAFF